MRRIVFACIASCLPPAHAQPEVRLSMEAVVQSYGAEVDKQLSVPGPERAFYAHRLQQALSRAGIVLSGAQYVIGVDRSAFVQAVFLYRLGPSSAWDFIGASPVSTGLPGRIDYFLTPLGVFPHVPENPDFRAEGTRNTLGILGYGRKGMRVFDFGWQLGERGWGAGGRSQMRLQMHATDPDFLEPDLGSRRSKGCIRIAATLNRFIDHYGILDAEYESVAARGRGLWILSHNRRPVEGAGRYLVVLDSGRSARPPWSPDPRARSGASRMTGAATFASAC